MTAFASDTFTGTSNTVLSSYSASWAKLEAGQVDMFISDVNRARMGVTGSGAAWYHSATPTNADYSVFCDVVRIGSDTANVAGVIGRAVVGAVSFFTAFYSATAGAWQCYRVLTGGFTQLGSNFSQTLTNGQTYRLELRMASSLIQMYVDGVQRVSQTDSNLFVAGKAGLRCFGATSQSDSVGIHVDNFLADDNQVAGQPTIRRFSQAKYFGRGGGRPGVTIAKSGRILVPTYIARGERLIVPRDQLLMAA